MNKVWVKFFASYVVVILLAMMVWGAASSVFIEDQLLRNTEHQLLKSGGEINQIMGRIDPELITTPFLRLLSGQFDGELYLTDINGMFIVSSLGRKNVGLMLNEDVMADIRLGQNVTRAWEVPENKERVITVATPMMQNGEVYGAIVLVAPVKGVEAATKAVQSQVVRASIIALILGGVVSLGVAYGMTTQIREISRGTNRFAEEDLSYRIPVITKDELGEVAQSFNVMAEQIALSTAKRRNLLAGVSHEVRTPLTNIRGYVEALRDKVIPLEDLDPTLDLIHDETLFMEKMVSDLIDLSRLDNQQYQLRLSEVNLTDLMVKVSQKLQQLAASKNNRIQVELEGNMLIKADVVRIEQLLTNLVKNALQFTEDGQVVLAARLKPEMAEIMVKDNGIGMEKDQIPLVFDSFYKVDQSRSKVHTESGLGLAIVQSIVKLHNGTIEITSEVGQGTTITITLPRDSTKVL